MPSLPRFGRPEFRCRNTESALSRCSSPNACRPHRSPPRQFPPDAPPEIERRPCPTAWPIGPRCPIALLPYLPHAAARSPLDRPLTPHGLPLSVACLARLTTVASRASPSRPRQVSASLENLLTNDTSRTIPHHAATLERLALTRETARTFPRVDRTAVSREVQTETLPLARLGCFPRYNRVELRTGPRALLLQR